MQGLFVNDEGEVVARQGEGEEAILAESTISALPSEKRGANAPLLREEENLYQGLARRVDVCCARLSLDTRWGCRSAQRTLGDRAYVEGTWKRADREVYGGYHRRGARGIHRSRESAKRRVELSKPLTKHVIRGAEGACSLFSP